MSSNISERENNLNYIQGHWKMKRSENDLLQTLLPYLERVHWSEVPSSLFEGTASGSVIVSSIANSEYNVQESTTSSETAYDQLQFILEPIQEEIISLKEQNKFLLEYTKNLKREISLIKIDRIANYEDNWNGDNAKKFKPEVIERVTKIIFNNELKLQPSIFPTLRESIQLEFRIKSYFIEIEVFADYYEMSVENESTGESSIYENIEWSSITNKINEIRSKQ